MAAPINESYTGPLSPATPTLDSFPSHMLSSSISSLSSSTSTRPSPSYVSKTYRQSSSLFLTRRLPEALSTILPLITPPPPHPGASDGITEPALVAKSSRNTRTKVWTLYIAILNAIAALEPDDGKEAFGTQEWRSLCAKVRDGDVWEEVIESGYHGVEGDVDADVVINLATLLLTHARTQTLNQKRLESYLAAATTPNLDLTNHFAPTELPRFSSRRRSTSRAQNGAETPRDLNSRVKILELYTLHVLARNEEWDYAREFISVSPVLDEERREAFLQALQSLQEDQQDSERQELEEKQRQEEQLRRDVEEARRLRAENEEREKRQIEEERARREAGEVDYGIDKKSAGGSSAGRSRRSKADASGAPSRSSRATGADGASSGNGKAVAPSLGAKAAVLFAKLRAMGATLQSNPLPLMRLLAFIIGLVLMFGKRNVRERIARIIGPSWNKVKATAGMGVKVSYI